MHEPNEQSDPNQDELIARIGQLTRSLRQSIRELGLDKAVQNAAQAIPDARDRLRYVATMTEQAAVRVLNAVEVAQPIQHDLRTRAQALLNRRQSPGGQEQAELEQETRQFLAQVATQSQVTNMHLAEIMMAQGFQDLTGQVIHRMITLIGSIEEELLQVLVDHLPAEGRRDAGGLVNGPQIDPDGADVMSSQDQVDDLLSSMGF